MKKLFVLCLCVLSGVLLTSCDRDKTQVPGGEAIDYDRTQLYVTNYDGGIGTEWLYAVKKEYEARNVDVSWEEGKKGVQIIVDPVKDNGYQMINTFDGSGIDVMFNQNIRYNSWVVKDLFLDITDVVESTCEGEEITIEDKLYDSQKDFLKKNGKYFALPHYTGFSGVIYNIDLFEKKGFYFSKDIDNGNDGFIVKGEEKSCGPDGVYGTSDDGLPSSHEELFKLCDYMVSRGVTPFVWTGQYTVDYYTGLLNALYRSYEGKDDVMLNYTYNSGDKTTEIITDIVNGQLVTENVKITPENGYLLKQQTGRYYAVKFFSDLLSNNSYYHPYSIGNLTFSHTDAQEYYYESELKNEPIAFLVEGQWWENEAKTSGAISRASNKYGVTADQRNFGFLPIPSKITGRVEEGEGNATVLQDGINAFAGINADIAEFKVDLAKDFLKFCYSDSMLELFTKTSSMTKALKYDISDDAFNSLTPFAQSVWEMKAKSDIIFPYSSSEFFNANQTNLTVNEWVSTVDNAYEHMLVHFKNKKDPNKIFLGGFITKETWMSTYFS